MFNINMNSKYSLVIVFTFCLNALCAEVKKEDVPEQRETCLDHKGKVVTHGDRFFPLGSDPCTQCTCSNGKPEMCISVFCSAPENCRQYHPLSDKCCEFVCLDRDFPNKGNGSYPDPDSLSPTNLGLRLAASTVATFLILALLMFMVHRLRQRRLLRIIRRCRAGQMDNGTAHLSRRYSEDDDGSVGYFAGHDHLDFSRYDEPPPPYTLWKPPEMYIPSSEAPPPYDLSVQLTAPFSSTNGTYNFETHGRTIAQQHQQQLQQSQEVSVTRAENRIAAMQQNIPPAFSVIAITSQIEQSNSQSNVVTGSNVQSCSSASDTCNPVTVSSRSVLPPDSQYEEPSNCTLNVQTEMPSTVATTEAVIEDNGPSEDSNPGPSSSSFVSNAEGVITNNGCTCNAIRSKLTLYNKRHSSGEHSEQNWLKSSSARNRRERRQSIASASRNQTPNMCPDPTAWNGDASESSSSSSITLDQPTPSPTTSDSSFADAEFPRHSKGKPDTLKKKNHHQRLSASLQNESNNPRSPTNTFPVPSRSKNASDDDGRTPTLQKTLSHLKRFSLMKRRKKRKQEDRSAEISCSIVCQNLPDAVLTSQPLSSTEVAAAKAGSDLLCGRPLEAINPHIGHKLASSGHRKGSRPTSINLPSQMFWHIPSEEGSHSSFYSSLYSIDNTLGNTSMIAIHSRPKTRNRRAAQVLEGCSCGTRQLSTPPEMQNHSNQSPSSRSGCGISRSGSICSETGERRYHKSSTMLSPGTSQQGQSTSEDKARKLHRASHSQERVSIVPNESRSHRNDTPLFSKCTSNSSRTLPVWIVNSEALLPKPDYQLHRSSSGILLNRCLSAGQISESSQDSSSFGSNLHPALRITDPSMCDSNWEACSHL